MEHRLDETSTPLWSRALGLKVILSTRNLAKKINYFFFSHLNKESVILVQRTKAIFPAFRIGYLSFILSAKITLFNTILYKVEPQIPEQEGREWLMETKKCWFFVNCSVFSEKYALISCSHNVLSLSSVFCLETYVYIFKDVSFLL